MARIPRYNAEVGLDTAAGSVPSSRINAAPAAALADVGDALGTFAVRLQEQQDRVQGFQAQRAFIDFNTGEDTARRDALQSMQPGAQGFADAGMKGFDERAAKFLASVPPRLRPEYEARLAAARGDAIDAYSRTEVGERNRWYEGELGTVFDGLSQTVLANPDDVEAAKKQGLDLINASGLPPARRDELTRNWLRQVESTAWRGELSRNPDRARAALGIPSVDAGPPDARQERAFQFFRSRGYSVEAAAGIVGNLMQESGARLSTTVRGDGGMSVGVAQWNRDRLKALGAFARSRGLDMHDLDTQLAFVDHELNTTERGAGERLRAARTIEDATDAFIGFERPQGWSAGNPRGGHGWQNRARNAYAVHRRYGGQAAPDPRFADLDPNERMQLANEADREIAFRDQQAVRDAAAERSAYKGAWELGIETGDRTDRAALLDDPMLTSAEKADLLPKLEKADKERRLSVELDRAYLSDEAPGLNPYVADDRKAVDRLYGRLGGSDGLLANDPVAEQRTLDVARWSGVVPPSAVQAMRAGLDSRNPDQVEAAMRAAARIYDSNPAMFAPIDGASSVSDAGATYSYLVNTLGLSGRDAARRFIVANDPETKRRAEASKPAADAFLKDMDRDAVLAEIDPSGASAGFTPAETEVMTADLKRFARERFERHGDPVLATAEAVADMRRTYGATAVAGETPKLMRFPPERYYPPVNGGYDYVTNQLVADVNAHAGVTPAAAGTIEDQVKGEVPGIGREDIVLVSVPQTVADIRAGRLPRYGVVYFTEENGQRVMNTIDGALFRADPKGPQSKTTGERGRQFQERREDRTILERENEAATGMPSRDEMFPAPPPEREPRVPLAPAQPPKSLDQRLREGG